MELGCKGRAQIFFIGPSLFTLLDRRCYMTSLLGKNAVVTGGSSGVGKATVKALISEGVRVTAVARGADRLRALEAEGGDGLPTLQGDTADPAFAERLLGGLRPDLGVLSPCLTPQLTPLHHLSLQPLS